MITQNNGVDGEHPNAGVVAGLRECADWLEQHPEVTDVNAHVWQRTPWKEQPKVARMRLRTFAEALGDEAFEEMRDRRVVIGRRFQDVTMQAESLVTILADAPESPPYDPIIPARSEAA